MGDAAEDPGPTSAPSVTGASPASTNADRDRLRRDLDARRPGFWEAVVGDARVTARYRRERHRFRSRADAAAQVVRLAWVTDAFLAQIWYRAEVSCREHRVPVLPVVLHRLSIASAQVSIGPHAVLQPGIYLPHGQVVVDGLTLLGEGVVLRPFVTLGLRDGHVVGPQVGEGVRIGTGAKVIGPVTLGAEAQVGANAVVIHDVPAGAVAVGVPARVVGAGSGAGSEDPRD